MATKDIEKSLYNGRHLVHFKNASHRYYVDGILRPGVTTILGKVLAKPGLALWPLNMALRYLSAKLPTITEKDLEAARQAHIQKRDAGSDTGTIVHYLVEQKLRGIAQTRGQHFNFTATSKLSEYPEEVQKAFGSFLAWFDVQAPLPVAVEQVVYSRTWKYPGTFDSILDIEGVVYLCDLKTTNASQDAPHGVYAENFVQLGAYYLAYEEQRRYELAHGGTSLAEINDLMIISCRKDGGLNTHTASEFGLTPANCAKLWKCILTLHTTLGPLGNKLARPPALAGRS